jgi:mono/diheme cytochrome c family protein
MKRYIVVGAVIVVALAVGVVTRFTVSAVPEPGRTETFLATKAKRFLVHKGSRGGVPAAPADREAATKEGDKLFRKECASCHGTNGYNLTDAGRWMYPRAADLTSRDSQAYSDQEVFWIVKNGVRLSGMPAFGKVESDEHIWDLVFYVRALPKMVPKPEVARK